MAEASVQNLDDMLQERHDLNYPPFSRIIEITFRDTYEDRAIRKASILAGHLNHHFGESEGRKSFLSCSPVTGPYAPVVDKIADQYIRTIRISLKKDRNLHRHKKALREMTAAFEKAEKYSGHISIDVDPA
jgi:primosomal protein N' (replication factor Y)